MKVIIRYAELRDCKSIAELSNQLGYKSEINTVQKRLTELLGSTNDCVFVALENKKVLGWIHGFYSQRVESDPFIEIGGLVVGEKFRKNGIGQQLVQQLIHWSESKKCSKIRVRCNAIRKESHLFYQKIGFNLSKEQKIFDKKIK